MLLDAAPYALRRYARRSAQRTNDDLARRLRRAWGALDAACLTGHAPRRWRSSFGLHVGADHILDNALLLAHRVVDCCFGALICGPTGALAQDLVLLDALIRTHRRLPEEWDVIAPTYSAS